MPAASDRLDIVAVLREEIEALPPEARAFAVAQLERRAGERYRVWAGASEDAVLSAGLRLCAAREDTIAEMIEAEFPAPAKSAGELKAALARIEDKLAGRFAGFTMAESFASQAAAERAGSQTWNLFAQLAQTPQQRWTLEICAGLETQSAEYLDVAIRRLG
jgi:hypothetical protein